MLYLSYESKSQGIRKIIDDSWYKISPEVRVNVKRPKLEFRWRPIDYTFPFKNWRMDFMIGRLIGPFKIFIYTKGDKALDKDRMRYWLGVRLDFNHLAINDRLVINLQYRYFEAMNDQSVSHHYAVQFLDYRFVPFISAGLLGFGRKNEGSNPTYFVGPLIKFWWSANFQTLISWTKDLYNYNSQQYLGFIRQSIVFTIK